MGELMIQKKINILLVEDEEFDVHRIKNTIKYFKNEIVIKDVVSTGNQAIHAIEENLNLYDVVIMDYQISGGIIGEKLIQELKRIDDSLQIIVVTKMTLDHPDLSFANNLIKSGAFWFGTKNPIDIEEFIYQPTDFILAIYNAYEKKILELDKKKLVDERDYTNLKLDKKIQTILNERPMVSSSQKMKNVKDLVKNYAATNANVLILGESGTGKELVARNIHYSSKRKYEQLVIVNCSAIPENLIESELFGFEKGAFTDAKNAKAGLFEQAHSGTIFLDEISELPLIAQAKLLRVLEVGELDKIGRKKKYQVDVRVIAATNKNLLDMIDKNVFREDLFYRLNILNIQIPPLRERPEDIKTLTSYFTEYYSKDLGLKKVKIDDEALEYLIQQNWPGNIRQLKNVLHRLILTYKTEITVDMVISSLQRRKKKSTNFSNNLPNFDEKILPLREAEKEFKKRYCSELRTHCKTDAEAAQKLGLAPSNFSRLLKELNLK